MHRSRPCPRCGYVDGPSHGSHPGARQHQGHGGQHQGGHGGHGGWHGGPHHGQHQGHGGWHGGPPSSPPAAPQHDASAWRHGPDGYGPPSGAAASGPTETPWDGDRTGPDTPWNGDRSGPDVPYEGDASATGGGPTESER